MNHHPSQSRALAIAVYLGCACLLLAQIAFNFVDIDIWHQMALIRSSVAAGHLITDDPFAYVSTVHPMINHEWGAGLVAYFLSKWMGGAGLLLLKFGAAFGALFLAMRLAEQRGATPEVLGFLVPPMIILLGLGFLPAVRAHVYSFFFIACLLWVLEYDSQGKHGQFWWWLAIFPLWVNLHAGFVVGMAFVFLYCVEQAIHRRPFRHAAWALCGMGAEVLINPYGVHYFPYLARTLTMARPHIPEWGPVSTLGWGMVFWLAVAAAVFLYTLMRSQPSKTSGVLLIAVSGVEAILHRKMLPIFAITWLCYVPGYFQKTAAGQWLERFARRRTWFLLLVWTVTVAVCLTAATRERFWRVEVPQVPGDASYPVGAVEYLAAQKFHGNVMTPFRTGAYVSWKLYPAVKVSVDSRYDVAYPITWVERMFRFYEGDEGWQQTLNAYPIDLVLVPVTARVRPLIRGLGWNPVYVDAQFELYARSGVELPSVDRRPESFSGTYP